MKLAIETNRLAILRVLCIFIVLYAHTISLLRLASFGMLLRTR